VFFLIGLIVLTWALMPKKNDLQSALAEWIERDTTPIAHIKDKTAFNFIAYGIWGIGNMLLGTDLGAQYIDLTGKKMTDGHGSSGGCSSSGCGSSCGGGGCGGGCGGCGG